MFENYGHGVGVSELPASRFLPNFCSPFLGNCWASFWSSFLNQIWSQKLDRGQHKPFTCRICSPVGSIFRTNFGSESWTKFGPNSLQKKGFGMQLFPSFFAPSPLTDPPSVAEGKMSRSYLQNWSPVGTPSS